MKKVLITSLQILVTLGILVYFLHDPHTRAGMWQALTRAKPGWLIAGIISYGLVEFLAGFRWFILLRVQDVRLPIWRVGALFMLGIFFNLFMPGGTGGDLLKVYYLWKEVPKKKKEGMLAVLMDRIIGLMALILIASTILSVQYHWLSTHPVSQHLTWAMLLILVCSLATIVFSFVISGFGLAHKLPARMPMRDTLIDMAKAYNIYAKAWPTSLLALVVSFGVHFFSFGVFVCAARALDVHAGGAGAPLVPFGALFTVMPIILTLAAIPISVGGTGVREGLFVMLLGALCGVTKADATMISLTGYMLLMGLWGLIGGTIYLLYRPTDHAKLSDIGREVEELEHEIAESE